MKFKISENSNIEVLPGDNGNAYSASKRLYNSISITDNNTIESSKNLTEAVDLTFGDNEQGGTIVLSTDVNAIDISGNKVINFIKKKVTTLNNRLTSTKKIDKIAQSHNLVGWTVGRFLNGRYTSKNGTPYGEKSLSIEIIGITSQVLVDIATELCREFNQEDVLVKDYNSKNIYLVNSEK